MKMAFQGPPERDLRATLALSEEEARLGSNRTLNLPGGRQLSIAIPAGVYNGQELRLEGQGIAPPSGGPAGALILTIAIAAFDAARARPPTPSGDNNFATDLISIPPPPP